jgi:hypothetical protein
VDIVSRIAAELAMEPSEVYRIAISADVRYREIVLHIPGKKDRHVFQPSSELRLIQRWCSDRLFNALPVHESCFSYAKGKNIAMHARVHAANNYLARIDIRQFFPSLLGRNVLSLLYRHREALGIETEREISLVSLLVTRMGKLVIGAPSSPVISNALLYDYDRKWSQICADSSVIYTRYADDLYLSTKVPNVLSDFLVALKKDLVEMPEFSFSINTEKDVFTSRRRLRRVTGIVLTPDGSLSIGRQKKRKIKALIHQALNSGMESREIQSLIGLLSHVDSVDRSFSTSLLRKYGATFRKTLAGLSASARPNPMPPNAQEPD